MRRWVGWWMCTDVSDKPVPPASDILHEVTSEKNVENIRKRWIFLVAPLPPRNYYRSSNLKIACGRREINRGLFRRREGRGRTRRRRRRRRGGGENEEEDMKEDEEKKGRRRRRRKRRRWRRRKRRKKRMRSRRRRRRRRSRKRRRRRRRRKSQVTGRQVHAYIQNGR